MGSTKNVLNLCSKIKIGSTNTDSSCISVSQIIIEHSGTSLIPLTKLVQITFFYTKLLWIMNHFCISTQSQY
jgi:hypothetical protein